MTLALRLVEFAMRILPKDRAKWGEAMKNEVQHLRPGSGALDFAMGCLWAAIQERTSSVQTLIFFGRLGVGIVTALYGAVFMAQFFYGVSIFLGKPDPFYTMLIAHHHLAAATEHLKDRPYILVFSLGMGMFNILAALFLIKWQPRMLTSSCIGIATMGAGLGFYCLNRGVSVWSPLSWAWPFLPLTLLSGAAYLLRRLGLRNSTPQNLRKG